MTMLTMSSTISEMMTMDQELQKWEQLRLKMKKEFNWNHQIRLEVQFRLDSCNQKIMTDVLTKVGMQLST